MPSGKAHDPRAPVFSDVPFSSAFETLRKAQRIVSSRTGILRRASAVVSYTGDPKCYAFGIVPCDTSQFSSHAVNTNKSGGAGMNPESALAATLGEAIERYCMLFYNKRDMVLDRASNLSGVAVEPALMSLYTREQVARRKSRTKYFDEDALVRWVWGYSLTKQCWRLVPASQVYLGYRFDEDEAAIAANASSGLAAGNTLEEAILTGLHEVIERDAFTISWLQRHLRARILVDEPALAELMREHYYADRSSVRISIFDVTLDLPIFCAFVIMERPTESGPAMLVGSAARLNPQDAIKKSLLEAGQEISYVRYLRQEMADWHPADDFSNVTTFDEHFMLYNKRPELIDGAFAFCRENVEQSRASRLRNQSTSRPLGDVTRMVELLGEKGHEVIVVDITTPDIRDIDLHVVRVIVPGLVPLHGDHRFPFFGVPRLQTITGLTPAELNPFPHPFP
jgi:ribosomal protein S12 methylthiotransferase accessory factor